MGHAERAHAVLAASSSKQWLACPPSARLSEQFPDKGSEYAAEGTLAHEIAELKLRKAVLEPMGPRKFSKAIKELRSNPLYQPEMDKHTDTYVDYVLGIVHSYTSPPYVAVEKRLDYSAYAPEGFGTGDCIIIGGDTLHIVDLKYGKGVPVDAEGNTQLRLYALGAVTEYGFLHPIRQVHMVIVQPRVVETPSEDTITLDELLAWGESIKPTAELAYKGEGEFNPGDHCRFCRAKAVCRARADAHTALEVFGGMKPPLISDAEVGQILERGRNLAAWLEDLEKYALNRCLEGGDIPGWKAVEGRGSRQYVDQDAAFKLLMEHGIDEAMLYERRPLSVPNVEKLLGKAKYRELLEETGLVEVQPGKPTLVPMTDKRQAITNKITAAEAFN
ncbi:hypothetical protein GCM10025857_40000 [Alicyclobacillus contaminans]|uniref:DUF2800 domain-containing protein n=1 Tax=Alicyclobacillus contaminans TaxID=392016 RepID=UPI0003F52CA8|nr:DUF2800 domain-containing protein [Alicyclobacillus contaminans]GMA52585.1 hypothetical protein GCM10025857_39420 [Alicyclobacillus contaminans]GMA52643.1 hypothetical protein GCM10025857_40000 [Alicyclobacillus contaminans]